jgi:hypothetical protein
MKTETLEAALAEALREDPGAASEAPECAFIRRVRTLMHELAAKSSIPHRWAYSAVAGGMTKLLERRRCQ